MSVLVPRVAALGALEEGGHGLVRTPNLYHNEHGLGVVAGRLVRAQDGGLGRILPVVFAAEHIVDLLALEVQLRFELLIDFEDVGTRLAEEAELARRLLREQDVGARGTKQHFS